VKIRALHSSKC